MILDTNAISALLKHDEALIAALGNEDHQLPVIALGEYRFGLRRSKLRTRLEGQLRQWELIWTVIPVVRETTEHYARVREALRARGTPIPENDVWIAALAVQHQLPVVTADEHFDRIEGVQRVSW
jgi:predicted nucleic acid-binding protein